MTDNTLDRHQQAILSLIRLTQRIFYSFDDLVLFSPKVAEDAITDLVDIGYLQVNEVGGTVLYTLTVKGYKYLNEHEG